MLFGVAPNERLLVRLIVNDVVDLPELSAVNGSVITTGDQLPAAFGLAAAQVAPTSGLRVVPLQV
jgi:hypothetical protein